MKDFIERPVTSAPIRDNEEKLEALLLEGLNSGKPLEITPEYWKRKQARLINRHGKFPV